MMIKNLSNSDIEYLLVPVTELNSAGEDAYYHSIYQELKIALREDDPRLYEGVWQRPLKSVDWAHAEKLCVQILTTLSKDLQVALWLWQAWTAQEKWQGLTKGLLLFSKLMARYSEFYFPQNTKQRIRVIESLDEIIFNQLVLLPLTTPSTKHKNSLNYDDWVKASHYEWAQSQAEGPKTKPRFSVKDFKNALKASKVTEINYRRECVQHIEAGLISIKNLTLSNCGSLVSWPQLKNTIDQIFSILTEPLVTETKEMNQINETEFKAIQRKHTTQGDINHSSKSEAPADRHQAYRQIQQIASLLMVIEPHSPTPHILKQLASWEKKTLQEIILDLGGTQDAITWLNLWFSSQEPKKVTQTQQLTTETTVLNDKKG